MRRRLLPTTIHPSCSPLLFFTSYASPRYLHSFPTRRSSDLSIQVLEGGFEAPEAPAGEGRDFGDRMSTRLNSSHITISYAVFCLKKKKEERSPARRYESRGRPAGLSVVAAVQNALVRRRRRR